MGVFVIVFVLARSYEEALADVTSTDFKLSGSFTFVGFMILSSAERAARNSQILVLLQIRPNYIHQFFGGLCLGRVLTIVRGEDVESHMPFHNFGHQTV